MSTAGAAGTGTGTRLAARLVALKGVAPDPVRHVIYRSTRRIDGTQVEGYSIPGETALLDVAALDVWLSRQPASIDRLAVAVLVIREILDTRGLLLQCAIERRRGSADGPFCGDPVRVEFTGPASTVRLYRGRPDGRLVEVTPSPDAAPPRVRAPEHFVGEHKAVQARFGEDVRILDVREPTLFEDMVGLASIIHVRIRDGRELGCGIGWHGDMPFVLDADFPRFTVALELLEEDAAAVDAALRANHLVRGEIRLDEQGIGVMARRQGGEALFLLRPSGGQVQMAPHEPGRDAAGPDQLRWMRYAETYEGLTVLDAWRDGTSDDLLVVTGDASGQAWRHHIDVDGVETWRKTDSDAALAAVHRDALFPGTLAMESGDAAAERADITMGEAFGTAPEGSLLALGEAYMHATTALGAAHEAVEQAPAQAAVFVREMQTALAALEAHVTAAMARPDATTLSLPEERLRAELALIRYVIVTPPHARLLTFGADVAADVPAAGYDIEEAALCLALRRATASVFHCMKAIEHGIAELALRAGAGDPIVSGERDWQNILRLLRHAKDLGFGDAVDALDAVRRRWRGAALLPADKYTEHDAELIFQAVGEFLHSLARQTPAQT